MCTYSKEDKQSEDESCDGGVPTDEERVELGRREQMKIRTKHQHCVHLKHEHLCIPYSFLVQALNCSHSVEEDVGGDTECFDGSRA